MTRRDYQLLAQVLRTSDQRARGDAERAGVAIVAKLLLQELAMESPRFRVDKFCEATGISELSPEEARNGI